MMTPENMDDLQQWIAAMALPPEEREKAYPLRIIGNCVNILADPTCPMPPTHCSLIDALQEPDNG